MASRKSVGSIAITTIVEITKKRIFNQKQDEAEKAVFLTQKQ